MPLLLLLSITLHDNNDGFYNLLLIKIMHKKYSKLWYIIWCTNFGVIKKFVNIHNMEYKFAEPDLFCCFQCRVEIMSSLWSRTILHWFSLTYIFTFCLFFLFQYYFYLSLLGLNEFIIPVPGFALLYILNIIKQLKILSISS